MITQLYPEEFDWLNASMADAARGSKSFLATFCEACLREPIKAIVEPLSVGLVKCPRCGAPLYEMPGDVNWCRYFECRACDAVFHFEGPTRNRRRKRRAASLGPKPEPPPVLLVPGRRHRSELAAC
jgi:hypothetical protein